MRFTARANDGLVMTDCNRQPLLFHPHARREVVADFDGGTINSDAEGLLLREVEQRFGIVRQFVACVTDHRDEEQVNFPVEELLLQRIPLRSVGTGRRSTSAGSCWNRSYKGLSR